MHLYSIPVIQQDLRHEEAIIQAANAFEHLENVINDVFTKINKRIDKNNARCEDIRRRISVANGKIESLVGIKKAITIYSPAKYPAGETVQDIEVTFPAQEAQLHLNNDYTVESTLDPVSHKRLQDKLHFYHVRKTDDKAAAVIPEGLGAPPRNIESISSFLLFNTTENPYEHYKKVDPLSGTVKTTSSSTVLEEESQKMEAAPLSISNRNAQPKKVPENFFYTPQLDEAPALDVPDDLPDLPGIAGDVTFSEEISKMLPMKDGVIPEAPSTLLPTDDEIDLNLSISGIEVPREQPKPVEVVTSPPPPPPPQPLPEPTTSTPVPKDASKLPAMTDARSNLMEAIRQAGGKAKLRAAEQTPAGKSNPAPTTGDLMADLHNKLSMRRKGISGAKDGSGVMDRMSALIPPPPKPSAKAADASEDDDWE